MARRRRACRNRRLLTDYLSLSLSNLPRSFISYRLCATDTRVQAVRPLQVSALVKRNREKKKNSLFFFLVVRTQRLSPSLSSSTPPLPPQKKNQRYFDPSTELCLDFPGCHGEPASEELAWDCGPCSAFPLDGGNGHCERAPGCSLSGSWSGGSAAAATVLASGRRGGGGSSSSSSSQQQKKNAAAASSSEQKQINDVAAANAVVFNLHGAGSVSVGMPPTGGRRAAASAPASSRSPSSSSSTRSPSSSPSLLSSPAAAPAVTAASGRRS